VFPRAVAFALAAFTLGILFVLIALISGFVTGSVVAVVNGSIFGFFDNVLRATTAADLAIFPAKLLLIGLMVALACCATGLAARETDAVSTLLPRGFTRGVTVILAVTLLLSALI
jgi:phospholipid/cholesterol/gamma-HCH transport system permease protein